jgi:hypothetical protein
MVTFDELKSFEGKNVVMLTKNASVYSGLLTNIRSPKDRAEDYVAFGDFNYTGFIDTAKGPMTVKENSKEFPIRASDEVIDPALYMIKSEPEETGDKDIILEEMKNGDIRLVY